MDAEEDLYTARNDIVGAQNWDTLQVFDNMQELRNQLKTQEKVLINEHNTTIEKVRAANTRADEAWRRVEKERNSIRDFNGSDGREFEVLLQENEILERSNREAHEKSKILSTALAAAKDAKHILDIKEIQLDTDLDKAKHDLAAGKKTCLPPACFETGFGFVAGFEEG